MSDLDWNPPQYPDNGYLRDLDGIVARIVRLPDGTEQLWDMRNGGLLGVYDPRLNMTSDLEPRIIGWGNLLGALVPRSPR